MPHAKSLRAIGQSLEGLGVVAFVMQKDGRNYVIQADSFPHLASLADKKNLSEKIWDLPSLAKKTSELLKENGSPRLLPTYFLSLACPGAKKKAQAPVSAGERNDEAIATLAHRRSAPRPVGASRIYHLLVSNGGDHPLRTSRWATD